MSEPVMKLTELELKQKRGRIKGSLTRAKHYIENLPDGTPVEELETRAEKLDGLWEEFIATDDALVMLNADSDVEDFEPKFFSVCARYQKEIRECQARLIDHRRNSEMANQTIQVDPFNQSSRDNSSVIDQLNSTLNRFVDQQRMLWDSHASSSTAQHRSIDVKLPKVNIPCFSGDFKEWPSFKDLYEAMVDKRTGLSAVHKMQYLKGLVKGEAATLIKHLPVTDDNYKEAWDKLKERYDKRKHILTAYIKSFYSLPTAFQGSLSQLRLLADSADELIRGVNALGDEAKGRDPWLIYTILSKADSETRKQWSEESVNKDTPTLREFFDFLNKRCDALQACELPTRKAITRSSHQAGVLHSYSALNCIQCSEPHQLFKCSQFQNMDVNSRRTVVSKHSLCFNCLSQGHPANKCKSKNRCHHCGKSHHTLLHEQGCDNKPLAAQTETRSVEASSARSRKIGLNPNASSFVIPSEEQDKTKGMMTSHATSYETEAPVPILPTALVHVHDAAGNLRDCRILIDSGSQGSFISEGFAVQLGHKREPAKLIINGIGSIKSGLTRGRVLLTLHSRHDHQQKLTIYAYVLPRLTSLQPTNQFNCREHHYVNKVNLADPNFNRPGQIDIILGAEHFVDILEEGKFISPSSGPSLQNTMFGYIVSGSINASYNRPPLSSHHTDLLQIDQALRSFWEVEELPQRTAPYTEEEQYCETLFQDTHQIDKETGRYVVRLPIKKTESPLGNTLDIAISRLRAMERKFIRDSSFNLAYQSFMEEYSTLGHLESIPLSETNPVKEHAYLPHHAVMKPSSTTTKLRVVFDGSASSDTGISLNKRLCVGPKVQRDLFPILTSFRTYKVAMVADIKQMYRQVQVNELDRDYQRIVWRQNQTQLIQHYRLTTVTYGTSAAPFLATRALKQVANDFKEKYPLATQAINENFYVDDLLGGAENVEIARRLYEELTYVLAARGFPLHKWASNSSEFLSAVGINAATSSIQIKQAECIKVLGLKWESETDYFAIDVNTSDIDSPTKRLILSESSRLFDPLGLLAPVTIIFKIMLQQLWLENYGWDEPIRGNLYSRWEVMHTNLHLLEKLRIPRWLHTSSQSFELHGYADASEAAYAAVVYCSVRSDSNEVITTLIAAKTRVALINKVSIPRLELNAAHLLSKLLLSVKTSLNRTDLTCIAWTDSQIVLDWLSSHPCYWKTYIANRTSEILSTLPRSAWHHVHSADNPADLASRGLTPKDLINSKLWWEGPAYLKSNWKNYLHDKNDHSGEELSSINHEKKTQIFRSLHTAHENDTLGELFNNKSSLMTILHILGRLLQFAERCKGIKSTEFGNWLTSRELESAQCICIKWTQQGAFQDEISKLKKNHTVSKTSTLASLNPFLDKEGILRVGGRLERVHCAFDTKHPVILPKDHPFVKLLIAHLHQKHLHVGTNGLLSIIRQKYWVISCRAAVKKHIASCIRCVRQRAKASEQLMANLPIARTSLSRAFENTGVDYAGPITLLKQRGRGAKCCKGYIALFTCLSTRAMHLEVASDLSSDAFIACLRRFIARRGIPRNMYSDNGTNFIGANRKLCNLYKLVSSKDHQASLISNSVADGICWHFNPPSAPHFGGSWESGVKLVKTHLHRSIGETRLTYEEFATLLAQIEGVLNSRPLTPITDDADCFDVLTPGHFLIGRPLVALPEDSAGDSCMTIVSRWRLIQKLLRDFWNRWHKEYLVTLQHRPKWRREESSISIGDVVIIREDNISPAHWILGRVIALHPGHDNLVRVVTLRTSTGELKRPIAKLCKLPIVKDT